MAESSSVRMMDILPFEMVADSNSVILPVIAILILIFALLTLYYRYHFNPLRTLKRQLLQQNLSPRQVAHELARIVELDDSNTRLLQRLRFGKTEPLKQQLVTFFYQIQSSHHDG